MYVSDSLFNIQHLFTNAEDDDQHGAMFASRLRDILKDYEEETEPMKENSLSNLAETDPDKFIDHMVEKSKKLSGVKE